MSIHFIIGKNFGDEGKGLATDYFSSLSQNAEKSCLVIRHNGGAQAGHTVDLPEKRFVFHQLSSGSFRNADTYWAQTFLPDLYKLPEEAEDFLAIHGKLPRIFAHPRCRCVYIDDILINMALETSRGGDRHGSCGMGINEAVERSAEVDSCIYLGQIYKMSQQALLDSLRHLRRTYLPRRLQQLGLTLTEMGEYGELLSNETVLENAAAQMHYGLRYVELKDENFVSHYDDLIFEGAQGLLLDEDRVEYAPHLTSSKTGIHNPAAWLQTRKPDTVPEAVYVTRSYVTRHGAGCLPYEKEWEKQNVKVVDPTNLPNPWQGSLRFAPHGNEDVFFAPIDVDVRQCAFPLVVSCFVTHLNETQGNLCSVSGNIPVLQWFQNPQVPSCLGRVYLSCTPFSQDVSSHTILPNKPQL